MFLKSLSITLSILLTAAMVHNVHLEGLLRDRAPTVFYQEQVKSQIITQETINQQPSGSIQLLPPNVEDEQNDSIQNLDDILANNNNPVNHSDALFGGMVENKAKKKKK